MALIQRLFRKAVDGPAETTIASNIVCTIDRENRTIVFESEVDLSIRVGDLISSGDLPHGMIVDGVQSSKTNGGTIKYELSYISPLVV